MRALEEFAVAPFEAARAPRRAQRFEVRAARGSRGAGRDQRRARVNRAVAIDAIEFDGGARLAVEFSVAVAVLLEVAIHALHAFLEMDVREVHGFLEFLGILGTTILFSVEQVALAVALEHGAEEPAVAVKIGELRVCQFRVEFGAAPFCQKFRVGPQPARRRAFRIALRDLNFSSSVGLRCCFGYIAAPSDSLSHQV